MRVGPMPEPTAAPPAVGLDDVTNGIGAVVDVEQGALRALQQHGLAGLERLVEQQPGVGDAVLEALGLRQRFSTTSAGSSALRL